MTRPPLRPGDRVAVRAVHLSGRTNTAPVDVVSTVLAVDDQHCGCWRITCHRPPATGGHTLDARWVSDSAGHRSWWQCGCGHFYTADGLTDVAADHFRHLTSTLDSFQVYDAGCPWPHADRIDYAAAKAEAEMADRAGVAW